MRPDELIAALRPRLSGALIATDFDGTLAPIVADPELAAPVYGAVHALRELVRAGARVAVISGRDARTVLRLGGLDAVDGLRVEGLYGLERWCDGTLDSPDEPAEIGELRSVLPTWLRDQHAARGVWVEDKRLSLVVHTRPAAAPQAEQDRLAQPAAELAARLGLELHAGRNVLEFRLPGYDKGSALRRLVADTGPTAVLYLGDDRGDLPAFAVVAELRADGTPGWSVAAASAEFPDIRAAADVTVDGPAGVVALLAELVR